MNSRKDVSVRKGSGVEEIIGGEDPEADSHLFGSPGKVKGSLVPHMRAQQDGDFVGPLG